MRPVSEMGRPGDNLPERFSRVAALRPAKPRLAADAAPEVKRQPVNFHALAALCGAAVEHNHYGEHLAIRRWFPTPEPCFEAGDPCAARALELLLPVTRSAGKNCTHQKPRHHGLALDPAHWLFLDTETTGLAGGSGMYAFLVGLAWWQDGGLAVEQFFMRDFGEEHALLTSLNERLAERRVLVTFNGKSFDWPLLETRFRMTRVIEPCTPALHLDFLHPARQIWRPRMESVRLAELERDVLRVSPGSRLDWTRDADVDSAMIPEIYFQFLRGGSCEPLLAVFRHNQMDLRGLAAIAARVLELLAQTSSQNADANDGQDFSARLVARNEPADLYGLARLLDRRGKAARARAIFQAALGAGLPPALERTTRRELARHAKRAGDLAQALELWESLLESRHTAPALLPLAAVQPGRVQQSNFRSPAQSLTLERILLRGAMGLRQRRSFRRAGRATEYVLAGEPSARRLREMLEACEQLAIFFEHHAHQLDRAKQLTCHALALIHGHARGAGSVQPATASIEAAEASCRALPGVCRSLELRFTHRLARLERKLATTPRLC
jgi:uncharacterized protein YprB with RNaseH-like and TPR domain